MKKTYKNPTFEVVTLESVDLIAASADAAASFKDNGDGTGSFGGGGTPNEETGEFGAGGYRSGLWN